MARELCRNCGHELPNAAGPGLYCPDCGEPVDARAKQIAQALAEEQRLREIDGMDLAELAKRYDEGWRDVHAAMRALEPLHRAYVARVARCYDPDLTAIPVEPTDQGGPGWVYGGDDADLNDDSILAMLLSDYGEFKSSDDHDAHDLQLGGA